MEALQMGMRNMVANATNGEEIIGKQNEIELKNNYEINLFTIW